MTGVHEDELLVRRPYVDGVLRLVQGVAMAAIVCVVAVCIYLFWTWPGAGLFRVVWLAVAVAMLWLAWQVWNLVHLGSNEWRFDDRGWSDSEPFGGRRRRVDWSDVERVLLVSEAGLKALRLETESGTWGFRLQSVHSEQISVFVDQLVAHVPVDRIDGSVLTLGGQSSHTARTANRISPRIDSPSTGDASSPVTARERATVVALPYVMSLRLTGAAALGITVLAFIASLLGAPISGRSFDWDNAALVGCLTYVLSVPLVHVIGAAFYRLRPNEWVLDDQGWLDRSPLSPPQRIEWSGIVRVETRTGGTPLRVMAIEIVYRTPSGPRARVVDLTRLDLRHGSTAALARALVSHVPIESVAKEVRGLADP